MYLFLRENEEAFVAFFENEWLQCMESHLENRKAEIIHQNDIITRHNTWGIMFWEDQK